VHAANHVRDQETKPILPALAAGGLCAAAVLAKSFPGLTAMGILAVALPWKTKAARSLQALLLAMLACGAVVLPWSIWVRDAFPAEAAWE